MQRTRKSSLPVRPVVSANNAANTAAWPSSGARILGRAPTADSGHGDRAREEQQEDAEEEEGSHRWSFLHPLVLREARTLGVELTIYGAQPNAATACLPRCPQRTCSRDEAMCRLLRVLLLLTEP